MPEQPRYFTIFDLLSESLFLLSVTTGCYLGWQVGETFISLFFGGAIGYLICRILGLVLYLLTNEPPTSGN